MSEQSFSSRAAGTRRPLVTIAIPFYRPGAYFELAVRSVFGQSFTDWELLLMDDGGGDGALELARELEDPRVRVLSDGRNLGLAARLNQAARLARGRYLFRMDADDIMHPERVERQVEVLEFSGEKTVLGTAAYSIDEHSHIRGLRPANGIYGTGYAMRHSFLHPTVAAATTWFQNHPYSESSTFRRSEDAELWCRTAAESDFRWLDRPLLFYREVGVFKMEHYAAAADGLLELIRVHEQSPRERSRLRRKVKVKMTVARLLNHLNASGLLVRQRFSTVGRQELLIGSEALRLALGPELPRTRAAFLEV